MYRTVRTGTAEGTSEDSILERPGAGTVRQEGLIDGYVSRKGLSSQQR
jgi:hypothetical protein